MDPQMNKVSAAEAADRQENPSSPQGFSLHDLIGVTRRVHLSFQKDCRLQLERIGMSGELIMQRRLRADVAALGETLRAIVLRCEREPDDIRKEIGLPAVLKRVAGALEDYVDITAQGNAHPAVRPRLEEIERMAAQAVPWLKDLLTRMQAGDGEDMSVRARVLSSIFQVKRDCAAASGGGGASINAKED